MANPFTLAVTFVLQHEGGYSNDPVDPGGETNYGISKRQYPNLDIKGLTRQDAVGIYKRDYWDALNCGDMSFDIACVVFDTCVNMGAGRAKDFLEKSKDFREYCELRVQHYLKIIAKNPKMVKYKNGWLRRVTDLKKFVAINAEQADL